MKQTLDFLIRQFTASRVVLAANDGEVPANDVLVYAIIATSKRLIVIDALDQHAIADGHAHVPLR